MTSISLLLLSISCVLSIRAKRLPAVHYHHASSLVIGKRQRAPYNTKAAHMPLVNKDEACKRLVTMINVDTTRVENGRGKMHEAH